MSLNNNKASDSLRHEDMISDYEISSRIDYLAWLEDDELSGEADRMTWADEIEELKDLRALVAAIGDNFGTLISEDYWETYACNDADELFDLDKTGAYKYFEYSSYADDLQTDYSQVKFGEDTYYYA